MLKDVTLTGTRIQLVPLGMAHINELFVAGNHDEIWTYLPKPIRTLNDMTDFVTEALNEKKKHAELPFTVVDLHQSEIIGSTRFLNISEAHKSVEIGWTWYSPKAWRTYVNTECKYVLLQYCFEELGLNRVQLKTDVRNDKSNRAILRLGAKFEGTLRKDRILHDGYIRNTNMYSILDEEWNDVKQKLKIMM